MATSFIKKKASLILDFIAISITIILIFSSLLVWFLFKDIKDQSNIVIQKTNIQGDKLSRTFADILDFTAYEMNYIGRQIRENDKNHSYIKFILGSFKTRPDDVLSWSTFLWSDKNHQVLATNNFGMLEEKKDLSSRDYIPQTKLNPWHIYTGKPVYGITSGKWAIPAGLGVTDKKGNYIGTVVTGLTIDKLILKFENYLQIEEISFAILNNNLEIVAQSHNYQQTIRDNGIINEINKIPENSSEGLLTATNLISDGYAYYHRLKNYPYIIITSYDKSTSDKFITNNLLFGIGETLFIIMTLLSTLFYLYRRVVNPIMQLSIAADNLAKGQSVSIPRGGPHEIHILAKQLVRVQRYIKKIHRIEKQLIISKEIAEEANAAKSQFLANMSHELRTPLNSILGYSEMIKRQILGKIENKDYLDYAGYINSSGQHLLILINDILDISKAEAGHFSIYEATFDPKIIINESMEILNQQAMEYKVNIKTKIPANIPKLFGDEIRIKQSILNIMSNAIKFSHKGGTVILEIKSDNTGFSIIAEDNGIGIAPEDIHNVLNKFGQANSAMHRKKGEGSGLGLWLTKILIECHQGTVNIESELHKGTKVIIWLPESRIRS